MIARKPHDLRDLKSSIIWRKRETLIKLAFMWHGPDISKSIIKNNLTDIGSTDPGEVEY